MSLGLSPETQKKQGGCVQILFFARVGWRVEKQTVRFMKGQRTLLWPIVVVFGANAQPEQ